VELNILSHDLLLSAPEPTVCRTRLFSRNLGTAKAIALLRNYDTY